ncbi:hypothetical protein SCLCIDRAFT_1102614 [Scleroderma citrinum Foug A]|uniref:Uncharacterized protein n=1 Tax=Scleroderma citrinum Foug A TaxID=1036808 RepID=A0A0C3DB83_9AGAM|nr:hypothetical protein SCLCIDRAFT_1102614 [Scleroderma citrinum Foug A]
MRQVTLFTRSPEMCALFRHPRISWFEGAPKSQKLRPGSNVFRRRFFLVEAILTKDWDKVEGISRVCHGRVDTDYHLRALYLDGVIIITVGIAHAGTGHQGAQPEA